MAFYRHRGILISVHSPRPSPCYRFLGTKVIADTSVRVPFCFLVCSVGFVSASRFGGFRFYVSFLCLVSAGLQPAAAKYEGLQTRLKNTAL